MLIITQEDSTGMLMETSSRKDRDRRYSQTAKGRATRNAARKRYEQSLRGWCHKQIRRMRYRCENRNAKMWLRYGGRGVRLRMTADDLMKLIGDGPWPGMVPHRINNDGDYHVDNVVLLTPEDHRAIHNDGVPI